MSEQIPFRYGIDTLDATTALALAQGTRQGVIDDQAKEKIAKSHLDVAEMAQGSASVYGINTGFGPLCTTKIAPKDRIFYHDIEKATQWVSEGVLLDTVKSEAALQGISLKTAYSEQFDQY